jgi:2'-5' RNA ligase
MTDPPISRHSAYFMGAFLEGALAERLQEFRQRYNIGTDPFILPHVTLVRSFWRPAKALPEAEMTRLLAAQQHIQPFELKWGRIGCFVIPRRVIYLTVEPIPGLLAARQKLREALQLNDQQSFTPHLTLAKDLSPEEFEKVLSQLEQAQWRIAYWPVQVKQLWLMQREENETVWRCIRQLDLGRRE